MKPDADEQDAIERLKEWDPSTISGAAPSSEANTKSGGAKTRAEPGNPGVPVDIRGPSSSSGPAQPVPGDDHVTRVAPYAKHAQLIHPTRGERGDSATTKPDGPPSGLGKLGRPASQCGGGHYRRLDPEPITVIESWGLGFRLANVVKYIARAGNKPGVSREEDLRKAAWYLDREIQTAVGGVGRNAS